MDFLDAAIEQYVIDHTQTEPDVLQRLNRETNLKVLMPRMLSGHLQGRVLGMLSCMIKPEHILEIGTYTGYSAICLASGLVDRGKLITIDINKELEKMVRKYFDEAGVADKIDYRIGNAMEIIPGLKEKLDLVFIDADKENYSNYYDLVFDKVNKGGFIIADNVLWSGKVLMDKTKMDKDTKAIYEFNNKVHNDKRVEHVLFPVRDGLMVIRKMK
ncbi:MAG: O-methyltransferase [Bacteroidetes bacterium]|nr:O-methyltransferase [Bacteroidota bacterium]